MKRGLFLSATLLVVALNSCKEEKEVKMEVSQGEPSVVKLEEQIEGDSVTVSPKLIKRMASEELKESFIFTDENVQKENLYLADTCRIVYGYDSRPKYYEWDVLEEGKVVAMVTTFAQKEEDFAIAFMFEYPVTREKKRGLEMFEGLYPIVYWGVPDEEFGNAPKELYAEDGKRRIAEIPSVNEDERYDKILANMDDYSRTEAEKMLSINRENRVERKNKAKMFWAKQDDNALEQDMDDRLRISGNDITSGHPNTYYVIPAWGYERLKKTHWNGPCGPAAVAWVFRGLYTKYPITSTSSNAYINIFGDSEKEALINGCYVTIFGNIASTSYTRAGYYFSLISYPNIIGDIYNRAVNNASRQVDNGLYEEILSHTVKTLGNGVGGYVYPMYQAGMNNAIKAITNNGYKITTTTQSRKHIQNNHLPVFIMIGTGDDFHYLVAFGCGSTGSKNYVYITDNGTYIGDNGYYPYWRYEGSNYGIRYKLILN